MKSAQLEKSKIYSNLEILEYLPNSVVTQTILKKPTGNISVMSFDIGEGLNEKISRFDTFTQIIEGRAEIVIEYKSFLLEMGQSIIIPAHKPYSVNANSRLKMITTIIKSGYE